VTLSLHSRLCSARGLAHVRSKGQFQGEFNVSKCRSRKPQGDKTTSGGQKQTSFRLADYCQRAPDVERAFKMKVLTIQEQGLEQLVPNLRQESTKRFCHISRVSFTGTRFCKELLFIMIYSCSTSTKRAKRRSAASARKDGGQQRSGTFEPSLPE
jgi:hypothetical protein